MTPFTGSGCGYKTRFVGRDWGAICGENFFQKFFPTPLSKTLKKVGIGQPPGRECRTVGRHCLSAQFYRKNVFQRDLHPFKPLKKVGIGQPPGRKMPHGGRTSCGVAPQGGTEAVTAPSSDIIPQRDKYCNGKTKIFNRDVMRVCSRYGFRSNAARPSVKFCTHPGVAGCIPGGR